MCSRKRRSPGVSFLRADASLTGIFLVNGDRIALTVRPEAESRGVGGKANRVEAGCMSSAGESPVQKVPEHLVVGPRQRERSR
jgi:hypothetical protein